MSDKDWGPVLATLNRDSAYDLVRAIQECWPQAGRNVSEDQALYAQAVAKEKNNAAIIKQSEFLNEENHRLNGKLSLISDMISVIIRLLEEGPESVVKPATLMPLIQIMHRLL